MQVLILITGKYPVYWSTKTCVIVVIEAIVPKQYCDQINCAKVAL